MNEITALILALLSGAFLGVFFFGGLWWTIRLGVRARTPALWFLGSFVLRTAVVIGGIYLTSHEGWRQLIACVLGFWLARVCVVRSSQNHAQTANPQLTRALP